MVARYCTLGTLLRDTPSDPQRTLAPACPTCAWYVSTQATSSGFMRAMSIILVWMGTSVSGVNPRKLMPPNLFVNRRGEGRQPGHKQRALEH
jgi:hypothetical protein